MFSHVAAHLSGPAAAVAVPSGRVEPIAPAEPDWNQLKASILERIRPLLIAHRIDRRQVSCGCDDDGWRLTVRLDLPTPTVARGLQRGLRSAFSTPPTHLVGPSALSMSSLPRRRPPKEAEMSDISAAQLDEITPGECLRLIATIGVGRVAIGRGAHPPLVVPVNFVVDHDTIVFRSDAGAKLAHLNRAMSFQVDFVDHYHRSGWSVLVCGTVHEVDATEVEHLSLTPWVGGRGRWLRVVPVSMSGRTIRLPDIDLGSHGYL